MSYQSRRANAIQHLDHLLHAASGAHAEYLTMTEAYINSLSCPYLTRDNHGAQLRPEVDYIVIICPNKCRYYVNVDGDSILTACAEALTFASGKL